METNCRLLITLAVALALILGIPAPGHTSAGTRQAGPKPASPAPRVNLVLPPAGARTIARARSVVPRRALRPCVRLSVEKLPGPAIRKPCSSLRSGVHRSPWALLRRRSDSLEGGPGAGLLAPLDEERARVLDGARIRVIDGDTFVYGGQKIRIKGLNAPELLEPGGFEAMKRLDELLHEGQVVMVPDAVDAYGRLVAYVYVDESNVAETMRGEGYAKPKSR